MSVQNIALHIVDIDVLTDVPRHPYHVTLVTDATPDLDMRLKQKGITHVILVGLLANTCTESTGRYAMELGYHVTLVTDATAAFGPEEMDAAHHVNGPTYAHAILDTKELIAALGHSV